MVWNRGPYYTTRIDGSSLLLQIKVIHANQCVWAGSVGSSGRWWRKFCVKALWIEISSSSFWVTIKESIAFEGMWVNGTLYMWISVNESLPEVTFCLKCHFISWSANSWTMQLGIKTMMRCFSLCCGYTAWLSFSRHTRSWRIVILGFSSMYCGYTAWLSFSRYTRSCHIVNLGFSDMCCGYTAWLSFSRHTRIYHIVNLGFSAT